MSKAVFNTRLSLSSCRNREEKFSRILTQFPSNGDSHADWTDVCNLGSVYKEARGLKDSPGLQEKFTVRVTLLPETATLRLLRFVNFVRKARTDNKTGTNLFPKQKYDKLWKKTWRFVSHNSLILLVLWSYFAFWSQNRDVQGRRVVPSRAFTRRLGYPSVWVTLAALYMRCWKWEEMCECQGNLTCM